MTGVITDIGIELGKLIYWNKSNEANQRSYVKANREKLKTHTFIFVVFLVGGIVGAISFKKVGYISVVPLSVSLILIAGLQIYRDIRVMMRDRLS
jgi:small basic protein